MRVCPQCARENKPQAKFCDRCGFDFADLPPPVDRLPPGDTAKGVPPALAGIPQEVRGGKGIYRETQKLDKPMAASGSPTERSSHNHKTIKVARVPAPAGDPPRPQRQYANGDANGAVPPADPEPEATIQGAFYLRKQEAMRAASAGEHVGWLVELVENQGRPGSIWPVTTGITLLGSSQSEVGSGIVAQRPGLAPVHAMIFHRSGHTWLVDLDSGSPTTCNNAPLAPLQGHPLSEKDELHLGELVLSFRRVDPQSPDQS
jgi:hypothetical protein